MALDIKVHRPHHVRNEGEQKREKSNFLILEPINPVICQLFSFGSPVSVWCLTRESSLPLLTPRLPPSEQGFLLVMRMAAVFWPGQGQHGGPSPMGGVWLQGRSPLSLAMGGQSCALWQSCANHSRIYHMPAQEFKVRQCFPQFTCNT